MKKILLFSGLFLIVVGLVVYLMYNNAQKPYAKAEDYAIKTAKEEAGLRIVSDFYLYHGKDTFYVVTGKNEKKKSKVVWVPKDKKQEIIVKDYEKGLSKEDAVNKLKGDKNPAEILAVNLGMEQDGPVWELVYLNEQNQLNYYYLLFEDGSMWRNIENI